MLLTLEVSLQSKQITALSISKTSSNNHAFTLSLLIRLYTIVFPLLKISFYRANKGWWEMIRYVRYTFIDPLSASARDIGVTIIPDDSLGNLAENDKNIVYYINGIYFFPSTLTEIPSMGASIGVEDEKGGGPLGAFLNVVHNGFTTRYFLTNSHVFESARGWLRRLSKSTMNKVFHSS